MSSSGLGSNGKNWVAVCATYVLVLQVLFAGWAAGSYAHDVALDRTLALTNCLPGSDSGSAGGHGDTQAHAGMDCCTAGCPMLVGADPVRPEFQLLARRPADHVAFARRLDRPVGYLSDHSPGNPRAPPALA